MKKILVFAGSNSSTSINHTFVSFVASNLQHHSHEIIRLTDYPLPIYSEDIEKENGFPEDLQRLLEHIKLADGLIISVNEHNGGVSAFFKNILDWLSRIEYKFLEQKKVLVLSASPGKRGGLTANEYTQSVLPRYGAEVVSGMVFPSFYDNFSKEKSKIKDAELSKAVLDTLGAYEEAL